MFFYFQCHFFITQALAWIMGGFHGGFTVDISVETVTFSSLKHLLGPWRTSFLDLCTDTLPALVDLPALLVTLRLDDSVPDEKGLVGLYTGQTSSLLKSKSV